MCCQVIQVRTADTSVPPWTPPREHYISTLLVLVPTAGSHLIRQGLAFPASIQDAMKNFCRMCVPRTCSLLLPKSAAPPAIVGSDCAEITALLLRLRCTLTHLLKRIIFFFSWITGKYSASGRDRGLFLVPVFFWLLFCFAFSFS